MIRGTKEADPKGPGLPTDVQYLLDSVPEDKEQAVQTFISEVMSWGEVDLHRGNRRNGEGGTAYIRLHRRGSNVGAFAYFRPRRLKLTLRLPREAARKFQVAEARKVQPENRYQVKIYLKSPEAVKEALALAKAAYNEVVD